LSSVSTDGCIEHTFYGYWPVLLLRSIIGVSNTSSEVLK